MRSRPLVRGYHHRVVGGLIWHAPCEQKGDELMSSEESKAIVRRWHEGVFNQKRLSTIDELIDENYANYTANIVGLADARERFSELVREHPDVHLVTEDTIAEGDKVATRWNWYEKDKLIAIGMTIHRVAGGKIVEDWFCSMQMTTG